MPFTKGKSGNPNGRKAGTPNAVTGALRERVQALLDAQFERLVSDLETLEPKDRINTWLKLAEYVLPKLNRSEVVGGEQGPVNIKTWVIELPATETDTN